MIYTRCKHVYYFVYKKYFKDVYNIVYMTKVISIRIPEKIKQEMDQVNINWNEYIRDAIVQKVNEERRKEAFSSVKEILKDTVQAQEGFAAKSVREDRDV